MKERILVNVSVICDPPYAVGRWTRTMEQKAKALESWCREFEEFIRDHRSQDPIDLHVEREYQEQCSHCGREWEEDKDGPVCCDEAQKEWNETQNL